MVLLDLPTALSPCLQDVLPESKMIRWGLITLCITSHQLKMPDARCRCQIDVHCVTKQCAFWVFSSPPYFHFPPSFLSLLPSHQNQPKSTLCCEIWGHPSVSSGSSQWKLDVLFFPRLGSIHQVLCAQVDFSNVLITGLLCLRACPPAPQLLYNVFLINVGPMGTHKWPLSLCCYFSWVFRIKLLFESRPS